MFEKLSEKTPDFITDVTNKCFSLLEELKQSYRDKKSREWFERLKWSKQNICTLLSCLGSQHETPLNKIIIGGVVYNIQTLKDELVKLFFMLMKIKNEKCKLSDNAMTALKLLNDEFSIPKQKENEL